MMQSYVTTESRKGKHLTHGERNRITILKEEDYSNRKIADILMRSPQTINNEIKRGTVKQLKRQKQNGKVYEYYDFVYDADAVDQDVSCLRERARDQFEHLFKTIMSDNGPEFAGLTAALQDAVEVYFSHPYASWERGTSENQHKLIRRCIPKGVAISEISDEQIIRIQRWMNDYPRKVLQYQTPHDLFAKAFKKERQSA